MQELESTKLLVDMLLPTTTSSSDLIDLACKRYSASLVYTLAYGRRITEEELKAVLVVLEGFIADCYPGAHLVDTFPILDYIPDGVLRIFGPSWREEARAKHEKDMQVNWYFLVVCCMDSTEKFRTVVYDVVAQC